VRKISLGLFAGAVRPSLRVVIPRGLLPPFLKAQKHEPGDCGDGKRAEIGDRCRSGALSLHFGKSPGTSRDDAPTPCME